MPSCANSSNIRTVSLNLNVSSVGARLITTIDKTPADGAYTVDSGLTAGDVIRYQVTGPTGAGGTPIYKRSMADNVENAEGVGVVESATDAAMEVVIFGQINFPDSKFVNSGSPEGASGGNDVYFLSSGTSGGVNSLAPDQVTQVVKPVLQRMDAGDFNAVVLNYIGYLVGGEVAAEDANSAIIGSVYEYVDIGQILPSAHLKVSDDSHSLSVSNYNALYKKFGTTFGFTEVITLDSSDKVLGSMKGQRILQKDGSKSTYSGRIHSVDSVNNTLTIKRSGGQNQVDTTKKILIRNLQYDVTSTEITEFTTPKITKNTNTTASVGGSPTTATFSVAMIVDDTTGVTIPTNVSVDTLTVKNKLTTSTSEADTLDDINASVNTINTDISTIKSTLGLS